MAITQSTKPGNPEYRRLVILWILLLCFSPVHLSGQEHKQSIEHEDVGRLLPIYENEIESQKKPELYKNPVIYLCFLPGIIVLFVIIFFKKRKTAGILFLFLCMSAIAGTAADKNQFITRGLSLFTEKNYKDALHTFTQAEKIQKPVQGIFYNKALCYYHLNKKGYAIFELYRALKKAPMERRFILALHLIEKECGLASQVKSIPFVHPDIPFVSMIILFNMTCIALGLVFRYKKGYIVIIFVLLTLCTIGGVVSFITTQYQIGEKICVIISGQGMLKQIPLPSSRTWVQLKEGTSLKVLGNAKGYYLVKTGRGLKGWIRKEDIQVE